MALAVTHVIITIVLLDLVRHYLIGKKKFPRYLLVIGGIAGLFPDIDIAFTYLYNFISPISQNFHGGITHSLIFPLTFLVIGAMLHYNNKVTAARICYVISFGWFLHLNLDCLYGGYKDFLWPFVSVNFCPQWELYNHAISIDALILILWLVHEEVHNKIRDYI